MATTLARARVVPTSVLADARAKSTHLFDSAVPLISQIGKSDVPIRFSPAIQGRIEKARQHYVLLGAQPVYDHVFDVLIAAIRGRMLNPNASETDKFQMKLTELILYHPIGKDIHLPPTIGRDVPNLLHVHEMFKTLDSAGGDRAKAYELLFKRAEGMLNPQDLKVILYVRMADAMTIHDKDTVRAASTKMPGIFPVHDNWADVETSWSWPMLKVYCAVADRYGLTIPYREMRDMAMKFLIPEEYQKLERELGQFRQSLDVSKQVIDETVEEVSRVLGYHIYLAPNLYSASEAFGELDTHTAIWVKRPFKGVGGLLNKHLQRGVKIADIHDWSGGMFIGHEVEQVYRIMAAITELAPLAMRRVGVHDSKMELKDYMKSPKPNGYRSGHLDFSSKGHKMMPIEFIVRTLEMHLEADEGICNHNGYKGMLLGAGASLFKKLSSYGSS